MNVVVSLAGLHRYCALRVTHLLNVSTTSARGIVILTVCITGFLFLLYFLLLFLWPYIHLSCHPNSLDHLLFKYFIPVLFHLCDCLQRLVVLIEEVPWKLTHILAVLELGRRDLTGVSEEAILVEDLMHLVFDFGLQIQIFKKSRDHFMDVG